MKFTRLGGIVFSVILQALIFNAHSYSRTHHQDSDYFVPPIENAKFHTLQDRSSFPFLAERDNRIEDADYFVFAPIEETTNGLIYSGRFRYPSQPDSWKWIMLDRGHSVRYKGRILIFRHSVSKNFHTIPHCSSTPDSQWTRKPWRISGTHQHRFLRSQSRLKKIDLRISETVSYAIYYSGKAEIHAEQQPHVKRKPKPHVKRKPKPLEEKQIGKRCRLCEQHTR